MSAKKKPETTAQAPAGQEAKPEGNTAGTAADTQPDAAPADDAHAPADNDPPAGQKEETSPAPQPDPEAAEPEETPPAEQVEESPAENAELAQAKAALLAANCELAAYKAGVDSAMVADAITLAAPKPGRALTKLPLPLPCSTCWNATRNGKPPPLPKRPPAVFSLGPIPMRQEQQPHPRKTRPASNAGTGSNNDPERSLIPWQTPRTMRRSGAPSCLRS